jgi:hypothetical protein
VAVADQGEQLFAEFGGGLEVAEDRGHVVGVEAADAGFHAADLGDGAAEGVGDVLAAVAASLSQGAELRGDTMLADGRAGFSCHGSTLSICQCGTKAGSPEWNLLTTVERFHGAGRATDLGDSGSVRDVANDDRRGPPEDAEKTDLTVWKEKDLDSLVGHFQDSATLWEMHEENERPSAGRWCY